VYFPDYSVKNIIIRNADIQGMNKGVDAPVAGFGPEPNLLLENSYLRNFQNVNVGTNWSVNGCWMQNKLVEIRNTRLEAPPGRSLAALNMGRSNSNGVECLSIFNEVRVYQHNGNMSDNFQIYHSNSVVLPLPPLTCSPTTRAGFSNALLCPIPWVASGATPTPGGTTITPAAPTNLTVIAP
jgi:hypothetical protein